MQKFNTPRACYWTSAATTSIHLSSLLLPKFHKMLSFHLIFSLQNDCFPKNFTTSILNVFFVFPFRLHNFPDFPALTKLGDLHNSLNSSFYCFLNFSHHIFSCAFCFKIFVTYILTQSKKTCCTVISVTFLADFPFLRKENRPDIIMSISTFEPLTEFHKKKWYGNYAIRDHTKLVILSFLPFQW
jgi:hypothetical protein